MDQPASPGHLLQHYLFTQVKDLVAVGQVFVTKRGVVAVKVHDRGGAPGGDRVDDGHALAQWNGAVHRFGNRRSATFWHVHEHARMAWGRQDAGPQDPPCIHPGASQVTFKKGQIACQSWVRSCSAGGRPVVCRRTDWRQLMRCRGDAACCAVQPLHRVIRNKQPFVQEQP